MSHSSLSLLREKLRVRFFSPNWVELCQLEGRAIVDEIQWLFFKTHFNAAVLGFVLAWDTKTS